MCVAAQSVACLEVIAFLVYLGGVGEGGGSAQQAQGSLLVKLGHQPDGSVSARGPWPLPLG